MSHYCINCGVFIGPALVSLALILWGISTKLLNWSDLKDRNIILIEIGIVVLVFSAVWMLIAIFQEEQIHYLQLFSPALVGLAFTSVGVYRMRHDVNFTGVDHAYAGIGLYFGSLLWIYWVLEAFS